MAHHRSGLVLPTSIGFVDGVALVGAIGAALLLLGLVRGGALVGRLLAAMRSRSWPLVEGAVLESRVRSTTRWGGSRSRRVYRPEIVYEYEVEGRVYVADRVAIGDVETWFAVGSERIVDDHPVGARVPVHHHPTRPEEAALLAGPRTADVLALSAAIGASLIGGAIVRWSWSTGARPDTLLELVRRLLG